ncbi:MAG: hypothetical protein QOD57_1796 [Actinomycetota bacterium]|nr:hypothetical protein [Actinomycetota bacterium]
MTTLAPLPGRGAEPGKGAAARGGQSDGAVLADPTPAPSPVSSASPGPAAAGAGTVDLTPHWSKPPDSDIGGQAAWLFGLALALLTEGVAERVAMAEVLAEAAGRSRTLEGAYGRAVALVNEFPGDPIVHRTVDLLAKALLRSRRPSRAAEEA